MLEIAALSAYNERMTPAMPKPRCLIRAACLLLLTACLPAQPAAGFYLKLSSGYEFAAPATWRDHDSGNRDFTPVYGDGYRAEGQAGNGVPLDLFVGYRFSGALALEMGLLYRPVLKYQGQVNFPDAGDNQPVEAEISSTALSLNAVCHLLHLFKTTPGGWFDPYLGLGAGWSSNRLTRLEMHFPELSRPHTFSLPPGRKTSFCYTVFLGNYFALSEKLALDLEFLYGNFGGMISSAGDGLLERAEQTITIPVRATRAGLQTYGLRAGVKYTF